ADARQAHFEQGLSDVFTHAQHQRDRRRGAHRVRAERSRVLGAVPQRGPVVRPRFPDPARLLMLRRPIVAFALCALTLIGTRSAWAQDPLIALVGRPVASVKLDIIGRPDAPQDLVTRIDLRAGDTFTIEAERSSIRKLVSLGPFDAVEVSVADGPAG